LQRLAWIYLALAVAVPVAAVPLLWFANSDAQWAPAIATVGGVGGIGAAFSVVRRLQSDLDALVLVTSSDLRRSSATK
jgi:hypothetical protein